MDVAKFLLLNGSHVNKKDRNGNSAIHYCEEIETLELLIENGADIMATNGENKTV